MIDNLFLSVGAMKAGTTWLYEQLKNHPDIYFTPEKEIHYFANKSGIENQNNYRSRILKLKQIMVAMAKANPKYIAENINNINWYLNYAKPSIVNNDWYESLFSLNTGKKYCADFSNLYCQMQSCGWDNVKEISKNRKIIYTLRDPLKRLWSHYKFHMKWVGRESEVLDAGYSQFKELLNSHWFWVNAEYVRNYNLLKENLLENEIMVLYFEDFRENPSEMINQVQSFLGIREVEANISTINKVINQTKAYEAPDEWVAYMKKILSPEVARLKQCDLWCEKWEF